MTDAKESGEKDSDESLFDSVRAYLVATAVRLARSTDRVGPTAAHTRSFADRAKAKSVPMKPAAMLVHPSSAKGEQFAMAAKIHAWSAGVQVAADGAVQGRLDLGVEGIRTDMQLNRGRWLRWLESYRASSLELGEVFGPDAVHAVVGAEELDTLFALILDDIVPGTVISVVNSDAAADDRPRFAPVRDGDCWKAAPNLSTIFVAGNVMSRGLTLEGLTTTYFSRVSNQPSADTQMQMQRWFGFRGEFLELCRVFLRGDQLDLFATYHEHDEALRRDIIARMDEPGGRNLAVTVLQGVDHVATAKVSHVSKGVLSPGVRPFLRLLNEPAEDVHNQSIVREFFDRENDDLILDERAALLAWTFSAMELADILDALEFSAHEPARHGSAASLWLSMENHVGVAGAGSYPLYRAAGTGVDKGVSLGIYSPAYLGAYLRFWSASAGRQVPGLMTTDLNAPHWNLSPSSQPGAEAPRFSLALRFGSGDVVDRGPLAELPFEVRAMNRAVLHSSLQSEWGSRGLKNGVALGDEVLDIALRALPAPDGYRERRRADGGMLLIHPIARDGGGISLAFGLALPPGGPDHVRAEKHSND